MTCSAVLDRAESESDMRATQHTTTHAQRRSDALITRLRAQRLDNVRTAADAADYVRNARLRLLDNVQTFDDACSIALLRRLEIALRADERKATKAAAEQSSASQQQQIACSTTQQQHKIVTSQRKTQTATHCDA